MSLLEQVHQGPRRAPPRMFIYGTEGVGKSTTAAQAPRPIFIQAEDGLDQIDCESFPLARTFADVVGALSELYAEQHPYQTVVIDSLDWLERLVWDDVCREYGVKSIEKADGGYAKGYTHALTQWRQILDGLDALRNDRNMAIILLAHAKVEKFDDPESAAYDRYAGRRVHSQTCAFQHAEAQDDLRPGQAAQFAHGQTQGPDPLRLRPRGRIGGHWPEGNGRPRPGGRDAGAWQNGHAPPEATA